MDPMSITSAAVTFLTLSTSCVKKLRQVIVNVRDAPVEVLALSNELNDLNILVAELEDVRNALKETDGSSHPTNAIILIDEELKKAKQLLSTLDLTSADLSTVTSSGKTQFNRTNWARKKSKICSLLQEFVGIKRTLSLLLSSITATRTARIQISLEAVQLQSASLYHGDITPSLFGQTGTNQANNVIGNDVSNFDHFTAIDTFPISLRNPVQNEAMGSQVAVTAPPPVDWSGSGSLSPFLQTVHQVATFGSLTFHVSRLVRCNGDCECDCHSRTLFQSPRFFSRFFGQLFVGYAGLPVLKAKCSNNTCFNQYRHQLQVSYSFPGWMVSKTINMAAALTHNNEPSFGLTVNNRVAPGDPTCDTIFMFARNGNIPAIIDLFKQRKASPKDISSKTGQTPLHFALELGNVDTCKFLLSIGVSPYTVDDKGYTDVKEVSSAVLAKPQSNRAWDAEAVFQQMTCDHTELWDFSLIHRIVVGILHIDLQSALDRPDQHAIIDKPDNSGRTPLNWAARRGDSASIELLLKAGAKVSTLDSELKTPLHCAVGSADVRSVELLLMASSDIHARDIYGDSPIHIAAWASKEPLLVERLYIAGASLNARNHVSGQCPLSHAASLNHPQVAECLLRLGADVNYARNQGSTPLFDAMQYANVDVAKVILDYEAKVDITNHFMQTILHIVTIWGDAKCVELFQTHIDRLSGPNGVDIRAKDKNGDTAADLLSLRQDPPPGFVAAMQALINELRRLNGNVDGPTEAMIEDDESEFVDALEFAA